MTMEQKLAALQPGQSINIGCAWDGTFYVVMSQTVPNDWLGTVTRTTARGATLEEALAAEQEPER